MMGMMMKMTMEISQRYERHVDAIINYFCLYHLRKESSFIYY